MDRAIESGDDAAKLFPGVFGPSGISIVNESLAEGNIGSLHIADAHDKAVKILLAVYCGLCCGRIIIYSPTKAFSAIYIVLYI